MTIRKAKRLLGELTIAIYSLEDDAVKNWDKPEDPGQELKNLMLHRLLTERYTCRRALKSWLTRHTR